MSSERARKRRLSYVDRTTTIEETEARHWMFRAEGFTLDAPQQAKKLVADEHDDVEYNDLRARKVNTGYGSGNEYVAVVEVK